MHWWGPFHPAIGHAPSLTSENAWPGSGSTWAPKVTFRIDGIKTCLSLYMQMYANLGRMHAEWGLRSLADR